MPYIISAESQLEVSLLLAGEVFIIDSAGINIAGFNAAFLFDGAGP